MRVYDSKVHVAREAEIIGVDDESFTAVRSHTHRGALEKLQLIGRNFFGLERKSLISPRISRVVPSSDS